MSLPHWLQSTAADEQRKQRQVANARAVALLETKLRRLLELLVRGA